MLYKHYASLIRQKAPYPWEAVNEGFNKLGIRPLTHTDLTSDDILITWTPWQKSTAHIAGNRHKENGGKWLVMENGYLPIVNGKPYYVLGVNGFNDWQYHKIKMQGVSEIYTRWKDFNLSISPWQYDGDEIIVVGQFGHRDTDISMPTVWPDKVISKLRKYTSRPIVYMPKKSRPRMLKGKYKNTIVDMESRLESRLKTAFAVVVYSSKAAIESILHGVPVFVCGPYSIALPVAEANIARIETPFYPNDRENFFKALAYTQWNIEEIKSGIPIGLLV